MDEVKRNVEEQQKKRGRSIKLKKPVEPGPNYDHTVNMKDSALLGQTICHGLPRPAESEGVVSKP